jgi:hypothetical protein
VLAPGAAATGYLFTETRSSLAGSVYEDLDGDGVRDEGEPGIAGGRGRPDGPGGPRTTVTGADGGYAFTGLLAGEYALTAAQPAGYADGRDAAGTGGGAAGNDAITAIALDGGEAATGYAFGETRGASLSGRVVDETGAGVPGATVTVTGTDGAGAPLPPRPVTTGTDGTWVVTDLPPGTYTVTETQPAGYGDGPDTAGTAGGSVGNDVVSGIVLGSGTSGADYVFAEVRGSVAGVVYRDLDGDGVRDEGEPGVPGVPVALDGPGGPRSTTTGADGGYVFAGLLGGDYTLTETQPAGLLDGTDAPGSAGGTATEPTRSPSPCRPAPPPSATCSASSTGPR